VSQLRCAIYARFSSDRQSPTSITDQIRKCREHAQRNGWVILEEHLYADEAVSGASTDREGLQRLLSAVAGPIIPFNCILIDDSSRLTRRLADALNLFERLTFAGIRIVAVSQGVDSDNPQAELLMSVHGMIDAVYWRELAQKTHRGMQGRALGGFATGGRCFGYRSVKSADESTRLEIDEEEAAIVRRLFEMYASGLSLKRIAWQLNAEGVRSPQPQKGRFNRSWCVSSVRHILRNRRYVGKIVWNTRRKIRVPGTGKRVFRPRPESEWVTVAAPHLQIVSAESFEAVRMRFGTMKRVFGRDSTGLTVGPKRYLFSGLLKCGVCGGSIALVCGRGRHGADRYGCALHHQRGDAVCPNSLLVRRDDLETRLLQRLSDAVLREEVIDYAVAGIREELQKRFEELNAGLGQMRQRKRQIEGELAKLVQAIADGQPSQSLTAAIAERERELRGITDRLLEPGPESLSAKLDVLRTLAVSRLTNLRKLISHPESVDQARAALAEHFGKFTLEPVIEAGEHSYLAHGEVDFFGEEAMARTGGAGGQNRTGYARLFRAALYQ
jgi:site-specific DNA recombinase